MTYDLEPPAMTRRTRRKAGFACRIAFGGWMWRGFFGGVSRAQSRQDNGAGSPNMREASSIDPNDEIDIVFGHVEMRLQRGRGGGLLRGHILCRCSQL